MFAGLLNYLLIWYHRLRVCSIIKFLKPFLKAQKIYNGAIVLIFLGARLTRIKIYTFIFHYKILIISVEPRETFLDSSAYDKVLHVSTYYAVRQSSFIRVTQFMDPGTKRLNIDQEREPGLLEAQT